MSSAQRVLITGGLGYVGGRIAAHLAVSSPQLSLRVLTRRQRERVPPWACHLDVLQGDVLDEGSLERAVDGIDTVVHLAAINEIESQQDPDLALEVNGRGTHRLLRASHAAGVRRFIYFSTFHVYGPAAAQPITEATPTRPVHPYAITHRLAEDLVNWHRHSYGMESLVLRLSNGYGYPADPWADRWTLVFNDLCRQAVEKGEIRLRSSGAQHRDFVSLADIARGVQHLLDPSTGGWGDGLFNLGGDCSISILQVAQRVAAEFRSYSGREAPVFTGEDEDPQGGAPVTYSIEKLKQTGFSLAGNMSEEVQGTFKVCEQLVRCGNQER